MEVGCLKLSVLLLNKAYCKTFLTAYSGGLKRNDNAMVSP